MNEGGTCSPRQPTTHHPTDNSKTTTRKVFTSNYKNEFETPQLFYSCTLHVTIPTSQSAASPANRPGSGITVMHNWARVSV